MRLLGALGAATAGCYLAFLAALSLVLGLPDVLLIVFTRMDFTHFDARWPIPVIITRFPSDGSAFLYALHQAGFLISGAVFLCLGLVAGRRAKGWLRLWLDYIVFWSGLLLVLLTASYAIWNFGPLYAALQVLWPNGFHSLGFRIALGVTLAVACGAAAHLAVRQLLDSAADSRADRLAALARWLLLPVLLVGWIVLRRVFLRSSALHAALIWSPMLFGLLAGLPAALRSARPAPAFHPSIRGAALLLVTCGLTVGVLFDHADLARQLHRGDFVQSESPRWLLDFEAGPIPPERQHDLEIAANRRLGLMEARLGLMEVHLGLPPRAPRLHAYFYVSTAAKTARTGDDAPFSLEVSRREVHHLLAPSGQVTDPRGEALLLMHTAWGEPGSPDVARAIARCAVGNFHGVPLSQYASRITREEGSYTLRDLLQRKGDYLSPLVADALGGAWVESLVARRGAGILPALYREPFAPSAEQEQEWQKYQRVNAGWPDPPKRTDPGAFFHRGISFSHSVGGSAGYGSDRARQQLEQIRRLGANSIAIIPYAFTRAPRDTGISFRADERDDRVLRTIEMAKLLGLHATLKPQLWASGFTGNIVFSSDADFDRWFAQYRRWLLHFARMAQLSGADLLVIGNELGGVARREAAWRSLIGDLRRVYAGPLTYAASWGPDVEGCPFWDALDYIGVNMYYPLTAASETPRPDAPQVRELVEKFAALSRRYNKQVLFTEVGYPAKASAAVRPWDDREGQLDAALQRQCYSTVFEAFYDQPWLAGLYWWKWPSQGDGNAYDGSYSPIGKPALQIVARWYGRVSSK